MHYKILQLKLNGLKIIQIASFNEFNSKVKLWICVAKIKIGTR